MGVNDSSATAVASSSSPDKKNNHQRRSRSNSTVGCGSHFRHGNYRKGIEQGRLLMISDFIACDQDRITIANSHHHKKRRSVRLISCFILAFLGALAVCSSYESLNNQENAGKSSLSSSSSPTMIVSVMHVDYGVLPQSTKATKDKESIVLPSEPDVEIAQRMQSCCCRGGGGDGGGALENTTTTCTTTIYDPLLVVDTTTTREERLTNSPVVLEKSTICEPTAQVRITFDTPLWSLQALDATGKEKRAGGDEYYVVLQSLSSQSVQQQNLVAKVLDQDDGTYDLDFMEVPPDLVLEDRHRRQVGVSSPSSLSSQTDSTERGNELTVYLLYTCGMGKLGPPLKSAWQSSGALMRVYGYNDNDNNNNNNKVIRLPLPSLIRRPWNQDAAAAAASSVVPQQRHRMFVRQHRRILPSNDRDTMELLDHDHVVFFGDDNILAMGRAAKNCTATAKQNETNGDDTSASETSHPIVSVGNHSVALSFGNLPKITYWLDEWHGSLLRFPDNHTVTLVLGFNSFGLAFDNNDKQYTEASPSMKREELDRYLPLSWDQIDHLMACQSLIHIVREEYPGIRLYWRLPIPLPLQRIPLTCHDRIVTSDNQPRDNIFCPESTQYLSYFRMQQMHQAQKQLMEELGVPMLDLFDAYYVSPEQYDLEKGVYSALLHKQFVCSFLL